MKVMKIGLDSENPLETVILSFSQAKGKIYFFQRNIVLVNLGTSHIKTHLAPFLSKFPNPQSLTVNGNDFEVLYKFPSN